MFDFLDWTLFRLGHEKGFTGFNPPYSSDSEITKDETVVLLIVGVPQAGQLIHAKLLGASVADSPASPARAGWLLKRLDFVGATLLPRPRPPDRLTALTVSRPKSDT